MRVIKKPVEVEAVRFNGNCFEESPDWLIKALEDRRVVIYSNFFGVTTPNGVAHGGSWLIKGVEGELYACDDSVFQQSYERISNG